MSVDFLNNITILFLDIVYLLLYIFFSKQSTTYILEHITLHQPFYFIYSIAYTRHSFTQNTSSYSCHSREMELVY